METVADPPGLIGPFIQSIPVTELNSFFARCNMAPKYEIVSKPTEQEPDFMLKMTVGKMNSMGIGRTKAGAKQSALSQLLRTIIPSPNINDTDVRRMRYCAETLVMFTDESLPNMVMESLQRLCEARKKPPPFYRVLCEGLAQSFVTVVTCRVGPTTVIGMGKTKKRAKRHAAFKLLFYFNFGPGKYDQEEGAIYQEQDLKPSLIEGGHSNADFKPNNNNILLIQNALAELTNTVDPPSVSTLDDVSQSCAVGDETFHSCVAESTVAENTCESMENISPIPYETIDISELEVSTVSVECDTRHVRKARSDETLSVSRSLVESKIEELVSSAIECQIMSENFSDDSLEGRIIPVGLKKASLELCSALVGLEDRCYPQESVGDSIPVMQNASEKDLKDKNEPNGKTPSPVQQFSWDRSAAEMVNFEQFPEFVGDALPKGSPISEWDKSYQKGREKKRRNCSTQHAYNLKGPAEHSHSSLGPDRHEHKVNRRAPYAIPVNRSAETKILLPDVRARPASECTAKKKATVILKSMKQILQEFPELVQLQVPPSSDEDVCTDSDDSFLIRHPPTRISESGEFVISNKSPLQNVDHGYVALRDENYTDEELENASSLEPGEILTSSDRNPLCTSSAPDEVSSKDPVCKKTMDANDRIEDFDDINPRVKKSSTPVQASTDQLMLHHVARQDNVEDHSDTSGGQGIEAEVNAINGNKTAIPLSFIEPSNPVVNRSRRRVVQIVRTGKDKGLLFDNTEEERSKAKGFPLTPGKSGVYVEGGSEETLVAKCQTCGANGPKPLIIDWERDDFEERWVDPYAWEPLIYIFLQFAMAFVILVQIVIGILFIFTDLVTVKQMLFSMMQCGLVVLLVHFS